VTIALALAALRTSLLTIASSPGPLRKVYADPKESTSLGEFPCAVLSLAPQVEHAWSTEAMGGGAGVAKHDWTAVIYVFVGERGTPLPELHSRSIQWPQPIFVALVADITLGGAVLHIGDGTSPQLFTYQHGPIVWADGGFWGLKCLLPVVEKPYNIVMGP
jgi:hypothetical protein